MENPKIGDEFELTINDIAFGGKGISTYNNFKIFVRNAIPKQKLLVRLIKKRKSFGEAKILSIIENSHLYQKSSCNHFPVCGGCSFQHLDYDYQFMIKQKQLLDIFNKIGNIKINNIDYMFPAEQIFYYRNKMDFTFSPKRWLLNDVKYNSEDKSFALGLHIPGRFDKILNIRDCMIQTKISNEILCLVQDLAKESKIIPYNKKTHKGFLRNLIIRNSKKTNQIMINFVTSYEDRIILQPIVNKLIKNFKNIKSIVNNINSKKSDTSIGEYEILLYGDRFIVDKIGNYEFEISSNSFFQTNTNQAENLYSIAKNMAQLKPDDILFDLFCGTGSISIYMASNLKKVYGFEIIESAIYDAYQNMKRNGIKNCEFFQVNLDKDFEYIFNSKKLPHPNILLLDPPRAGIHPKLIKNLINFNVNKIIYISCNPTTQARDLKIFIDSGYKLKKLAMVDMFPHTPHIETVVLLTKK